MHSSGCCNLETNSPFHLKTTGIAASGLGRFVSQAFTWKIQWNTHYFCPLAHLIRHRRQGGYLRPFRLTLHKEIFPPLQPLDRCLNNNRRVLIFFVFHFLSRPSEWALSQECVPPLRLIQKAPTWPDHPAGASEGPEDLHIARWERELQANRCRWKASAFIFKIMIFKKIP